MGTSSPEVLVTLDRSRPRGLRAQIEDALRDAIRAGRLAPGTPLPSTRALAADLGVTRGVVVDAYDQLVAEGYLAARPGAGTVVNRSAAPAARAGRRRPRAPAVEIDFRPGVPDVELFPRAAWAKATRAALQSLPSADLSYGNAEGLPVLRHALADYLGRVRGVSADPDQVVVCDSFGNGFALLAAALRGRGRDAFAVEDPGYDKPRATIASLGARCLPVPVDGEGIDVDWLRATDARVAVVTPAHQSPTGVVLSPDRRQALLAWAEEVDGIVVDDDYDAEYRYDRRPVGSLQGIAPERVVYAGTASKSLAPGVRLGWLVLPPDLVDPVVERRQVTGSFTSPWLQATFAAFLDAGDLDRHLRRTRRVYRERRDAVVDALARHLPDFEVRGIAAGLHVLALLPPGLTEEEVVARGLAAGVRVHPIDEYRPGPGSPAPPALVVGYGSVTPADAERGIRLLAEALRG